MKGFIEVTFGVQNGVATKMAIQINKIQTFLPSDIKENGFCRINIEEYEQSVFVNETYDQIKELITEAQRGEL